MLSCPNPITKLSDLDGALTVFGTETVLHKRANSSSDRSELDNFMHINNSTGAFLVRKLTFCN